METYKASLGRIPCKVNPLIPLWPLMMLIVTRVELDEWRV